MNPRRELLTIIVPVRDEGSALAHTIPAIHSSGQNLGLEVELVLVDDGSRDDTWEVCKSLCRSTDGIRAIRFTRGFGKEAAMLCGLLEAKGDAVILMDSDLQHPPALVPEMVRHWREGVEIVEAVKKRRGDESLVRGWLSRLFYALMRCLSGVALAGATDFKLLDRRVVDAYLRMPETNRFFRGLIEWTGFRKLSLRFEVPTDRKRRSRWSLGRLFALSISAITAFSYVPLRLTTLIGFVTFIFNLVLIVQTLFMKLSGHAVEGFTTVIISVLTVGSATLICLGILGEYLARIYEEVKRRPAFFVSDRTDTSGSRDQRSAAPPERTERMG